MRIVRVWGLFWQISYVFLCFCDLCILLSLFDIVVIIGLARYCTPESIDTLQLCFSNSSPTKFQGSIRYRSGGAAPFTSRVKVWGNALLLYNNYAARCLDFLLPILEFLRHIIQHHSLPYHGRINRSTTSVRIIASWLQGEKATSQFCTKIPSKKLRKTRKKKVMREKKKSQIYGVAIHVVCWGFFHFSKWRILPRIRTACFARISRGVPRVAFVFATITLYLVIVFLFEELFK